MKIAAFQIDSYIQKINGEKIAGALVYGPDASVVVSRFNAIAQKIVGNLSDQFLVVNISKERASQDPAIIIDEFFSLSMFGGRKLIIIKDIDSSINNAIKKFLEVKNDIKKSDNFILLQASDLEKSNYLRKTFEENIFFAALPCYEDDDVTTRKLITQQLKRNLIEQDQWLIEKLFNSLGKNRQIIASEIQKIALYFDSRKISPEELDNVIGSLAEIKIDNFINNFIAKNYQQTSLSYDYLNTHGYDDIALARILSGYLQKLYFAKMAIKIKSKTISDIIKEQRLFFKAADDFRRNISKIDIRDILFWLEEVYNLEILLKTSFGQKNIFPNFIQKIAIK